MTGSHVYIYICIYNVCHWVLELFEFFELPRLINLRKLEETRLDAACKKKNRLEATSKSLRGHLARKNLPRGHFEATWLEKSAGNHMSPHV